MRICFVADANHPNTLNWAEYFAADLGHDVHILSLNEPLRRSDSVVFHHIKAPISNKLRYLFSGHPLKQLVTEISPHLVIGYRLTSYAYMAANLGFHPLVVVAQSEKAAGRFRVIRKPAQWLAAKYALRRADLALAWAPHMAQDMVRLGCDPKKIFVLPRGVDLRRFRFSHDNDSRALSLITTRGLKRDYDLSIVIEAVGQLADRVTNLKYTVVGDGPDKRRLIRFTQKMKIGNHIEFVGEVPYDSIADYLYASNIYISPVPEDGVSSSLLEAMAAGTFPIVTNIKANRYWQHLGCKLLLFKPGSVKDLVNNILEYHNNRIELSHYLQINRDVVQKRASWVANMHNIEQTLLKLLDTTANGHCA